MSTEVSLQKYPASTRLLHWSVAVIAIALIAGGMIMDDLPKGSAARSTVFMLHISFGLLVLALTLTRFVNRLASAAPPPEPGQPRHVILASQVVHLALYGLLFALPLLGWAGVSANGRAVRFFGVELPKLLAENKELGHSIMEVHGFLGITLGVIVLLHIAGAMYHHHVRRDNTMRRML
jgi:superoxide oxidase